MRFVLLFFLFYSCQVDSGFKDLTPDNDFNSSFFFNTPEFNKAMTHVGNADPDTVFSIERPEHLLPPSLFVQEDGWMTTDTFAFETGDFQQVLNVIVQTAEKHKDSIFSADVSADVATISLNGRAAYSVPGKYYLVPYTISTGEKIFIQITRTKSEGRSYWTTWYYTANGLWLIGMDKNLHPDKDAS